MLHGRRFILDSMSALTVCLYTCKYHELPVSTSVRLFMFGRSAGKPCCASNERPDDASSECGSSLSRRGAFDVGVCFAIVGSFRRRLYPVMLLRLASTDFN